MVLISILLFLASSRHDRLLATIATTRRHTSTRCQINTKGVIIDHISRTLSCNSANNGMKNCKKNCRGNRIFYQVSCGILDFAKTQSHRSGTLVKLGCLMNTKQRPWPVLESEMPGMDKPLDYETLLTLNTADQRQQQNILKVEETQQYFTCAGRKAQVTQ